MGKIEKFRECPAVGRRIKPIECGQNRGKNYACPEDCPHCPWTVANYDDFLEIEGAVDTKTMEFYIGVAGKFSARTNLNIEALHEDEDGEQIFQGNCYREFYQREHKPGKRLFDLWRESSWAGLVRDEPFVAGFKAGTRIALLECRSVVDDLRVECVDLLDEQAGVITVCDRGLAKTALQFQCFIGWVAAYPFFSRMHGIGYPLPVGSEPGLGLVRRHVRDMGGPHNRPDLMAGWLGENFVAFMERVGEESRKATKAMFRNTDFKECVAIYRLKGRLADLRLEGREDFDETGPGEEDLEKRGEHTSFVWLRAGESIKWESHLPEAMRGGLGGLGIPIWGQLRVFPDRVEISASSEKHFRPMREMAEEFWGGLLEFEKETVADLAKQSWPEEEGDGDEKVSFSSTYFPEEIEDVGEIMQEVFRAHYRKFLEDRIPALDNLTPREAALRPEMRSRLVALMKGHVQTMDGHSRKDGRTYDIGWVLDELGLGELKTPARLVSPMVLDTGWWEEIHDEETIAERLQHGIEDPESCLSLRDFPELDEYFESIDSDLLNTKELDSLVLMVNLAIGAFVPKGVRPRQIGMDEMYRETKAIYLQIMPQDLSVSQVGDAFDDLMDVSVQPAYLSFAGRALVSMTSAGKILGILPFGKRVKPENIVPILIQIEAFLRCLRRSSLG